MLFAITGALIMGLDLQFLNDTDEEDDDEYFRSDDVLCMALEGDISRD